MDFQAKFTIELLGGPEQGAEQQDQDTQQTQETASTDDDEAQEG